ncbi:hypothetical protein PAXINDRAFT_159284 [Paxillus involutus ATCC 200175]|uniref:Uncharacterized protein n=1 Tax=Paxillus involutus ATCC 200175 TaxID=664439 RepID=A0A0C9SSM6_PAXIN|nr:hypothetical protein PAXINDRAFT_159284 [Paxillus involutus ATCC 200175]
MSEQSPTDGEKYIPAYLRDHHRREQNLNLSTIAQRARGRARGFISAGPAPVLQRGRTAPRGSNHVRAMLRSVPAPRGMPYQVQPEARTTSGTDSFPPPFFPTSSESPYEPMDASEDFPAQQPDSPTSLERPVWPDSRTVPPPPPSPQYWQHSSETTPSSGAMVSAPVDYARVIPLTHNGSTIVPSTRSTPIPLIHGAPIPLAQSIPTLVPHHIGQPPPRARPVRVRKKAQVRASGFEQEDDEPIENNPPPPSSSTLGLYDDPEGGEDIHNDPLLCTEPVSDGSDSEALPQKGPQASSAPMTIPTPPSYEPPLNPLQVYQDAHTTWLGQLLIVMVAILHMKHYNENACETWKVWVQNECLQAKSLIRGAVTLRFESSEGSTTISSSYMKVVSCITHQVIRKDEGSMSYS